MSKSKLTLGQLAYEAGQNAGNWPLGWEDMGEARRSEWEVLAKALATTVRAACAAQLELTPSEIRLMAGEMSAQEMRTVQAVLGGLTGRIRQS